jgi:hypothetical protein
MRIDSIQIRFHTTRPICYTNPHSGYSCQRYRDHSQIKMVKKSSRNRAKRRLKHQRRMQCLLLLLPVELFIQIANELSFRQRLVMANDTANFGFMFLLPELWSMLLANLSVGNVEIKSSFQNPKEILFALESAIPKNTIKTLSIDISHVCFLWRDGDIISLIRILRLRQPEIKLLAFRHDKWIQSVVEGIRDWLNDCHIVGLVLAIPATAGRMPLVTSQSSLQYIYLSESDRSMRINISYTLITNLYLSCGSMDVNIFAKWFVNLKDFRINTLWIAEPFDESLKMDNLEYLYVGRISSVVGDYVLKLVFACPKVRFYTS